MTAHILSRHELIFRPIGYNKISMLRFNMSQKTERLGLPRMPVVMLLQLGAPTLCLRK